jgi:hypothetical protein
MCDGVVSYCSPQIDRDKFEVHDERHAQPWPTIFLNARLPMAPSLPLNKARHAPLAARLKLYHIRVFERAAREIGSLGPAAIDRAVVAGIHVLHPGHIEDGDGRDNLGPCSKAHSFW